MVQLLEVLRLAASRLLSYPLADSLSSRYGREFAARTKVTRFLGGNMSDSFRMSVVAALGIAFMGACSDSSGPSLRAGEGRVALLVTGRGPSAGAIAAPETIGLGGDVLVVQQVEIVVRKIELEGVGGDACEDSNSDANNDDDCEEVELGPLLIDLPLGGGTARRLLVAIAAGSYDEIELEVHKLGGDAADRDLLALHPTLNGVSIRVRGTFNGVEFVYVTDLDVEQEIQLSPPLVVVAGATAEITLMVDVRDWFLNATRTGLINPTTALNGQPNEGLVNENIHRSFEAECDND